MGRNMKDASVTHFMVDNDRGRWAVEASLIRKEF
jgi:hypothetical protein